MVKVCENPERYSVELPPGIRRHRVPGFPYNTRSNLRKHGVSFAHAEQALRDEMAFTVEDPEASGEQRFITLGLDALGRVLVVVHTQRGERTRVISARKASRGESEQYHA